MIANSFVDQIDQMQKKIDALTEKLNAEAQLARTRDDLILAKIGYLENRYEELKRRR